MKRHVAPTMLVVALLLAGCAATPEPVASGSPSAEPSVSPTPSPTPEPTKPAIDELVVSPEGLGPLRVGQAPPVTDPALDILVYDEDGCYFALEGETEIYPRDDYGIWISNYGVDPSTNQAGPFGVYVANGVIDTIGIYDEHIETKAGAHIGMTRDELLTVYPTGIELETENFGLDTYRLRGTTGDLIFTLWEREPGVFTVNQINVSHPGFEVPLGGSDYGVWGVCYGP